VKLPHPDLDRITTDAKVQGGAPSVRAMRLTVARVLQILAENPSWDALRADFPELEPEDIRQVLDYAAKAVQYDSSVRQRVS
jgi:uncharacterized protein (DUF433 family)